MGRIAPDWSTGGVGQRMSLHPDPPVRRVHRPQERLDRWQRQSAQDTGRHQVLIIGSGFGGLFGAKALRRVDVDVTMVAKTTHHLFQPLLYQVATGILSEGEIAPPT